MIKFDTYENFRKKIKPLDLVLFSGEEIISSTIKFLQNRTLKNRFKNELDGCSFSHVGIVVTRKILKDKRLDRNKLYIWESSISGKLGYNVKNIDGQSFLGVQLRDLDELVPKYLAEKGTEIAIARLKNNPSKHNRKQLRKKFKEIFDDYDGVVYDYNPLDLFGALFSCLRCCRDCSHNITGKDNHLFCSELVATVYVRLGILDKSIDPKNVLPMDFIGFDKDNDGIKNMIFKNIVKLEN